MKKLIFLTLLTSLLSLPLQAQYERRVQAGDTIRATVHPDRGWQLKGWYKGEQLLSTQKTLIYVPTADAVITVVIEKIPVQVAITATRGGTVTGAGNYLYGDEVPITATPAANYEFVGWYINDELLSTEKNYTLRLTDEPVNLVAKFQRKVFIIRINVSPPGSGTVEGAGAYMPGAGVKIEAFPALIWEFSAWDVGGEKVKDNPYFFKAGANHIITANMALPWWGWVGIGILLLLVGLLGSRLIYIIKFINKLFKN